MKPDPTRGTPTSTLMIPTSQSYTSDHRWAPPITHRTIVVEEKLKCCGLWHSALFFHVLNFLMTLQLPFFTSCQLVVGKATAALLYKYAHVWDGMVCIICSGSSISSPVRTYGRTVWKTRHPHDISIKQQNKSSRCAAGYDILGPLECYFNSPLDLCTFPFEMCLKFMHFSPNRTEHAPMGTRLGR